jgi:gas vesicle protein
MKDYEEQDPGLGYVPPDQGVTPEAGDTENRNPEQIERDIEMTRGRMSQNIDELGDRLSPDNLKAQAKSVIQNAAGSAAQSVGEKARRTGWGLVEMIRENPLPAIAVGAAATWLLTKRSPQGPVSGDRMARYAYSGPERRSGQGWQHAGGITGRAGVVVSEARERATDVASGVSERAGELGGRARQQSARLRGKLEHTMEEAPLAVAAGVAVLGLAMGLLLPGTEREDEMIGPTRDRLVDRAEAVTERVKDATVQAGREVAETVQDQIAQHKPELKEMAEETAHNIKEQVKSSAERVKTEAKEAARQPNKADLPD